MSFFTPEPMLYHANATGFELFGAAHLLSLCLSTVIVASSALYYLRLPSDTAKHPSTQRQAMLLVLSGGATLLILLKCVSYLALDVFEPLFWPLHICNLCEFAALGYAISPRSSVGQFLADLLFCWGLTGCLGALILPGWRWYCPAWSFASLSGFIEHALVFACGLCVLIGRDYIPKPQRFMPVLLATAFFGALFRVVNPLLGTNFFFVTNPTAVGGPFPWLVTTFGDPGFLLPYLALAAGSWLLVYSIYHLGRSLRQS